MPFQTIEPLTFGRIYEKDFPEVSNLFPPKEVCILFLGGIP
jgi:hypothetical protein